MAKLTSRTHLQSFDVSHLRTKGWREEGGGGGLIYSPQIFKNCCINAHAIAAWFRCCAHEVIRTIDSTAANLELIFWQIEPVDGKI
jgi:hypothetical protein